jgi:hypothetical protein
MEDAMIARKSRIAFEYRAFVFHARDWDSGPLTWMKEWNAHPLNEVSCRFKMVFQ